MAEITQEITVFPEQGHRGVDTKDDFVEKEEAYHDHWREVKQVEFNNFKDQTNAVKDEVNTARDTTVEAKDEAVSAASIATSSVNYKGDWVAGYVTTGYDLGMSVSYTDGFRYTSKVDSNLTEPTSKTNTTEWDWIEAIDPTTVYTKAEVDDNFEPKDATILKDSDIGVNIKAEQNYSTKTANYTAVANDFIYADSSGGVFTITLPITPTSNDKVVILDTTGSFDTNNVTLARNGETVMGLAEDMLLNISNMRVEIIYNGSDWRVSI